MKMVLYIIFIIYNVSILYGQDIERDRNIVKQIAGNIIENTSYSFVDAANNSEYSSTDEIPPNASVRLKSTYEEWHYTDGVINTAMINLSGLLGDKKYFDYAAKHIAFGMDNYKYFQSRYKGDAAYYNYPLGQLFTMKELDDCGAMGASMIDVYQKVKRDDYYQYIKKTAEHISKVQDRLNDGTLARKGPHRMTIWADDLYMSVPFLVRMGKLSGDNRYWDDAVKQVINFTKYLWDENEQLYYHCYYTDLKRNGVAHWGRCNGWVMMAQVQLLNQLPEDYPQRKILIQNLERQILGVAKYQGGNGLWHQIVDKNDSYYESSCSAMFIYCIARAVNQGWIDAGYGSIALRGWEGLLSNKITFDGKVNDICIGTGIEENLVFYYKRPVQLNDKHGLGSVIDAGIEIIKLKENLKKN
ncbi:MAG: glycoside hydrolase family 88 protein [Ignavibacteriaceae bacterium]